jgi:hypothetical protein
VHEVRMVEDVEELERQLQILFAEGWNRFDQGHVGIDITRTDDAVLACGTEGSRGIGHEGHSLRLQPVGHVLGVVKAGLVRVGSRNDVGAVEAHAGESASVPVSGLNGNPL